MSKEAAEVLRKARELISDPKRWTQGAYARHASGYPIGALSEQAACFCSIGALARVLNVSPSDLHMHSEYEALIALKRVVDRGHVPDFNDSHDHPAVLQMFDRAIAAAEAA